MTYEELLQKGPWRTQGGHLFGRDLQAIVDGMRNGMTPSEIARKRGWEGGSDYRCGRALQLLQKHGVLVFDKTVQPRVWRLAEQIAVPQPVGVHPATRALLAYLKEFATNGDGVLENCYAFNPTHQAPLDRVLYAWIAEGCPNAPEEVVL